MGKASGEVRSGAARFSVAVRAASIEWAPNLAGERYPKGVRTRFPKDPEGFFMQELAFRAGTAGFEPLAMIAV